jgi:hypothetical protein
MSSDPVLALDRAAVPVHPGRRPPGQRLVGSRRHPSRRRGDLRGFLPRRRSAFHTATIRLEDIRTEQEYGGVRVSLKGSLGSTRLALRVDIGFGDAVTPAPEQREYPTLLDHPAPRLWVYPRETFIAEQYEAMVRLGSISSRVKDLWDLSVMARHFAFDGAVLREAIAATFARRGMSFGEQMPEALEPAFYEDPKRARYWQEFQRQVEAGAHGHVQLAQAGEQVRAFLSPVWDSLVEGRPFGQHWPPGGPWQSIGGTTKGAE